MRWLVKGGGRPDAAPMHTVVVSLLLKSLGLEVRDKETGPTEGLGWTGLG